ncbi:Alpha/Beta hydrolase protein [Phaeosphaeriaceae sp. PMI808]|nr:Alpha/Beta hydrolase protein [Phaeosphaeriaceae sp. PMI808]
MTYPKQLSSLPYTSPTTPLQTLDIWLPRPLDPSNHENALWIIYIHGGAWRDPTQTSTCSHPTTTHLSPETTSHIAALASINYRLSPYPSHPTHPSSPTDPTRSVTHPTHLHDIAAGIAFLRREYGVKRWIGVGHSCGATLLCQYISALKEDDGGGPEGLVLTAGIYHIPLFLRNHEPPACTAEVARIYAEIVRGAFGGDAGVYQGVSPVSGRYGVERWRNGKVVLLGHSYEDELVERGQRDVMRCWRLGISKGRMILFGRMGSRALG